MRTRIPVKAAMIQTLLGIDWGQRHVGLSTGNTVAKLASPLPSVSSSEAPARLEELLAAGEASLLVMGLPRSLDGRETAQTLAIREVAENLRNKLQCELVFQDETLSSQEAAKLKLEQPDADLDSLAATVILQDYLNQL